MEKEIAIFKTDSETINVEVIFEEETVIHNDKPATDEPELDIDLTDIESPF